MADGSAGSPIAGETSLMNYFHLRRLFRHRENGVNREDVEAIAAMADRKQKHKQPKLQRRNALKDINYDPFASSSSSFASSSDDIVPFDTSFRIEGNEGDMDRLCLTLGLSGPEEFGIPADAWEEMKSRSSPNLGSLSRSAQNDDPTKLEEQEKEALDAEFKTRFRIDDEAAVSVELAPPYQSKNCCSSLDVGSSGGAGGGAGGAGGIKGARPPLLAPPPVTRWDVDDMHSASSWDIVRSFAPDEERGSSSCPVRWLGSSSSDGEDGVGGEGEAVNGDVVGREEENEVRIEETTVTSESPSFWTSNDEDSLSSTTETTYTISPNGSFRRNITSWQRGHVLGSGSFGTVYEAFTE